MYLSISMTSLLDLQNLTLVKLHGTRSFPLSISTYNFCEITSGLMAKLETTDGTTFGHRQLPISSLTWPCHFGIIPMTLIEGILVVVGLKISKPISQPLTL